MAIVARLLEDAAQSTGCESLGLRMARHRQLSSFGAVSLLLQHQPTLRHALDTLVAHMHLVNESLLIHLEDAGDIVILREDFVLHGAMRQSVELAMGVLWRMCEALLRERWRPQGVSFSHAPPADLSEHRRMFRCRITFGAEFNGIACRAADLDEPNPLADPALARYALRLVEAMPAHRAASVGHQARRVIYLLLPSGNATCAGVAQGMGRSLRTLQRELDREGLSFSELLTEVRHELALRYLDHPTTAWARSPPCSAMPATAPSRAGSLRNSVARPRPGAAARRDCLAPDVPSVPGAPGGPGALDRT